jgi:hypothetical protein
MKHQIPIPKFQKEGNKKAKEFQFFGNWDLFGIGDWEF